MRRIHLAALWLCACGGNAPSVEVAPSRPVTVEVSVTDQKKMADPCALPAISEDPASIDAACRQAIAGFGAVRDELVASASGIRALEQMNRLDALIDRTMGFTGLMANVHPVREVRDAHEKCERDIMEFVTALSLDVAVFRALEAVPADGLDALAVRSLDRHLRDYRRSGVDRDDATRARIAQIREELVRVSQDFEREIREDVRFIEVKKEELTGLPADFIDGHPAQENGLIRLTTDYPDFFPVQNYAANEAVRARLYGEFLRRGWPANDARLKTILSLRSEMASLLGYPTWADYAAEKEMAKDAATIDAFISQIAAIARPRMAADLKDVLAMKKKDDRTVKAVHVWDRFFYVNRIREERFGVNAEEVRAYFSFEKVLEGVLAVNQELFGVTFRPVETPVWHDSVRAFDVVDRNGQLGRFFLDMHPREGKYKHMAMFHVASGVAGVQLPMGALICNFPQPEEGRPALMEHDDVVTLFHEFGHLMHHILGGQSPWLNLSGISCESEFVETPSQLLEEWAWDPQILARFSAHPESGAPIPADLVMKMRAAEEAGKGLHVMRQLYFAAMSLQFHTTPPDQLDLLAQAKTLQKNYSPWPYEPDTYEYAGFGHLMGYGSEYYTYMWSLKLAKDIFTRFAAEGLMNRGTAADYRRQIIDAGGTVDAARMVEQFLGRPSNFDAFRDYLEK